jgi:hypothetical protein
VRKVELDGSFLPFDHADLAGVGRCGPKYPFRFQSIVSTYRISLAAPVAIGCASIEADIDPTLSSLTCGLLAGALALGGAGCGGAADSPRTAGASAPSYTVPAVGTITTDIVPPRQLVRGDGDADNPSDFDGNGDSDSARVGGPDSDQDAPVAASYRFPDVDDRAAFDYGHAPDAATRRAIEGVVRRYFAAAAAWNGGPACALLQPGRARTLPADFAASSAPAYMRGAKTCAEVLNRLFKHENEEISGAISVFPCASKGTKRARSSRRGRCAPARRSWSAGGTRGGWGGCSANRCRNRPPPAPGRRPRDFRHRRTCR